MADITVNAAYATVAEEDGLCYVGFVEGDEIGYALFRQPLTGGPVWFEVNDESFGAQDALLSVAADIKGLEIILKPACSRQFGWAGTISIRTGTECDGHAEAVATLPAMLGAIWRQD